ncbi:MAG: hypothetical protein E7197_04685 [Anaerovibrio sp.]|uniref:glycosyltransferase family 9 protein n=1 Tax=Anaerovibrio sp. TaxID=1872532 RepID=UPI0025BED1EF|nr:glycosyltransferase family 9 protein [Anaerovibrio sp.]MBE6099331.1 hypothetical protein [Anaerovibrio sp.]
MNESFLFPFEKVPLGSKILIYGAGELGQSYFRQMMYTQYCTVVGFVDKNFKQYTSRQFNVYSPDIIRELDFDYVILAFKSVGNLPEVNRILQENNVSQEKIIFIGIRKELEQENDTINNDLDVPLAFNQENLSVGMFFLSAIGGLFFIKRFLMSFIELVPECCIDIYSTSQVDTICSFYSDIKNINNVIHNLGTRYPNNKEKYDLSMRINSAGHIIIDHFNQSKVEDLNPKLADAIVRLQHNIAKESYRDDIPRIVFFQDRKFHNQNCYTTFDYGVFGIHDKKITIPKDTKAASQFTSLGLKHYITVNYGNGSCKDGSKIAKTWPMSHFNKFISLFKRKYPKIEVVQLGVQDAERISSVDRYVLGESFELVTHILDNSLLHVDIEGGLVHLATQLGTKCVVLFGPTPEYYFGYEENINIKVGNCHECCGVYLNSNRCAREMDKPECMYNITPEIVMERIDDYFGKCVLRSE